MGEISRVVLVRIAVATTSSRRVVVLGVVLDAGRVGGGEKLVVGEVQQVVNGKTLRRRHSVYIHLGLGGSGGPGGFYTRVSHLSNLRERECDGERWREK